ncbi:hypothetical protein ACFU44_13815 [Nocardia rhizosphaerihabitans]|uniref:hypothetical protein n=1 Tax=Nocardia rhizosphaerihabitans TaxID=1691570 RepID=UPI00366FD674
MNEKAVVRVIELEGVKLDPKAKYLILVDPMYFDWLDVMQPELERLIGDNFTILPIHPDGVRALELLPAEAGDVSSNQRNP